MNDKFANFTANVLTVVTAALTFCITMNIETSV